MKYKVVACILAGLLATPAAAGIVDEDVDLPAEAAGALGCDGVNVYANDEPDAGAGFYQYNEDDEKEACDPAPEAPLNAQLVDEDVDFPAEAAGAIGCDGVNVHADEAGNAGADFYQYNEDDEQEACEPAVPAPDSPVDAQLVDEDVDFPAEAAGAIGCDGVNVFADEAGNAGAEFYQYNEDDEQEACEPAVPAP